MIATAGCAGALIPNYGIACDAVEQQRHPPRQGLAPCCALICLVGQLSLIDSTAFRSRRRSQTALKCVRAKTNFVSRFKLIRVVSWPRANISLSEKQKLCILPAVPFPQEGRFAVVTDVGSGMRWTQRRRKTGGARSGRRRRVVLMPRRWHQGRGMIPRTTGAKEPGPRGERDISRKTIAQGMPADCGVPVVANACAFYTCTRGRGCTAHPAFPAPSVLIEGKRSGITPGQSRRGNAETCLNDVIARSESDEAIHSLFSTVRWIASLRSQ